MTKFSTLKAHQAERLRSLQDPSSEPGPRADLQGGPRSYGGKELGPNPALPSHRAHTGPDAILSPSLDAARSRHDLPSGLLREDLPCPAPLLPTEGTSRVPGVPKDRPREGAAEKPSGAHMGAHLCRDSKLEVTRP